MEFQGKIGVTYNASTPNFYSTLPLSAPTDVPSTLIVLQDDVGCGHLGRYDGSIETPSTAYTAVGSLDRWPLGKGFERYD